MQKWIVTGISGSERIELLNELKNYIRKILGKRKESKLMMWVPSLKPNVKKIESR